MFWCDQSPSYGIVFLFCWVISHSHCPCWGTQTPGPHPGAGCAWVPPPAGPTGRPGSDQLHTMRSQSKSPSGTKSSHRAMGQITGSSSVQINETHCTLLNHCFYISINHKPINRKYMLLRWIWFFSIKSIKNLPGFGLCPVCFCLNTNTDINNVSLTTKQLQWWVCNVSQEPATRLLKQINKCVCIVFAERKQSKINNCTTYKKNAKMIQNKGV